MDCFGALLDEAWQHKKQFARGVTSEKSIAVTRSPGAMARWAGRSTRRRRVFLLLYFEAGARDQAERALTEGEGLRRMDFCFASDGARVLFNAGLRLQLGAAAPRSRHNGYGGL